MNRWIAVGCLLLFAGWLSACGGDYRQKAIGDNDQIVVVVDSSRMTSNAVEAIHEVFGSSIETLPGRGESLYRLQMRDFRTQDELEIIQKFKNIILVGPIDDETNSSSLIRALLSDEVEQSVRSGDRFAFPLRNHWYRDQWTLILTGTDDRTMAERIRQSADRLVDDALQTEFRRWEEDVYESYEQTAISDSLMSRYGWSVRMQHDYVQTVDTLQVVSFRRSLAENDRWMWGWWMDSVDNPDFVTPDWINATRDSVMERYVQGTREGSYITTEYRRPVVTEQLEDTGRLTGWETLGTWRMTGDFMGGPFVNFTWYDPESERLFMIEYGQFAPSVAKRRFVQQFRAMGRTFRADSTFGVSDYPESYIRSQP
ncbi:MAG: DUF4837 family protein [Balneolaceae bacterium]